MICNDCRTPTGHEACKERNKNKQGADCDCLHRVRSAPVPAENCEAEADVQSVVE